MLPYCFPTVYAAESDGVQASISIEAKDTVINNNIVYSLYLDNADKLSSLILKISFTSNAGASLSPAENDCFDIAYGQWSDTDLTLNTYFGRTGEREGYSSDTRIKIADISVPADSIESTVVSAYIAQALCAGVQDTASAASKGAVTVLNGSADFYVYNFDISEYKNGNIYITAPYEQTAVIALVSYNENSVVDVELYDITLSPGENVFTAGSIAASADGYVNIMLWDSASGMKPLAEKLRLTSVELTN